MTNEERIAKRKELERLLRKCPEILTPPPAAKWTPFGKNRIYELIHRGDLRAFVYRGGYIIAKEDLIDYLLDHCEDPAPFHFPRKERKNDER